MKKLMFLLCCLPSFVYAKDIYTPPLVPTEAEARQAQIALDENQKALMKHWQARLAAIKQKELQSSDTTADTHPSNDSHPH